MNPLTERIRAKGYTLTEFLLKVNKSLSWYRNHNREVGTKGYDFLVGLIDELESRI